MTQKNFYDLTEDQQELVIKRIREAAQFEEWYELDFHSKKSLRDSIFDAMAAAVADALSRIDVWRHEDGTVSLGIADYGDIDTEHFEIPEPGELDEGVSYVDTVPWKFMP